MPTLKLTFAQMKPNLGLADTQIAELKANINICINCAGQTELDKTLDYSVKLHVTGPLQLLAMMQQAANKVAFV